MNKYVLSIMLVLFSSCSTCRGVMGFSYSSRTHLVDYTIKDYPAEKVGVLAGDEILYPQLLSGEAGEVKQFRVVREGKIIDFEAPLKCYNEWDNLTTWNDNKSEPKKK